MVCVAVNAQKLDSGQRQLQSVLVDLHREKRLAWRCVSVSCVDRRYTDKAAIRLRWL